jgi:hypothetical protein
MEKAATMRFAALEVPEEAAEPIDANLAWGRTITLEENDRVVNVLIRMNLDPRGGFLVADEQENQIRRYDAGGRLLAHLGRRGQGPGEFGVLHRALPLRDGGILALDAFNRGVVFDSAGRVVRTFTTPVGPVHDARLVNDTLLLLGGDVARESDAAARPRLHLWNLARGKLVRSFFVPPVHGRIHEIAANTAGFVAAAVRHDTVAAVFALTDTIYFFDLQGRELKKQPIPFHFFRPLSERRPFPGSNSDVVAAREWLGSFSLISHLFWMGDGSFLVQYQDRVGTEPHWRLLAMTAQGERRFEAMDTPYLLQADSADGGELYFQQPGSLTPNVWAEGRLRR